MRIVVFSERLRAPYDEGIKNFTVQLIRALATKHDVLALTSGGLEDAGYEIKNVDANRLLLSARLRRTIRSFQPRAILYVPTACATVFSYVRARMLRLYGQGARTVLITLQPRHYTAVGRFLVGRLAPDCSQFVLGTKTHAKVHGFNCQRSCGSFVGRGQYDSGGRHRR